MKKGAKYFILPAALVLEIAFLSRVVAQAQDQSGFISIDCGLPANKTYADSITGIKYISDAAFIDTGISKELSVKEEYDQQLWHLRSFPEGVRNCYTINVARGQKYLIRTRFFYGNYDNKNEFPEFDLYLGVSYWDNVSPMFGSSPEPVFKEIIHIVSTTRLRICLVNKGMGASFISSIELRPMPNDIYNDLSSGDQSLLTLERRDMGYDDINLGRYDKGDIYDRFWGYNYYVLLPMKTITTSLPVGNALTGNYFLPSTVMMTAATPADPTQPIEYDLFHYSTNNSIHHLILYFYFAELQQLKPNQSRVFSIFSSTGKNSSSLFKIASSESPTYLSTTMKIVSEYSVPNDPEDFNIISIIRDENSTLPPLINAIEVYEVVKMHDSQTKHEEAETMMNIKLVYGVTTRNWQGDPCAPEAFIWDGIKCSLDASNTSNIISLNLSSAELSGIISPHLSNLNLLQVLDLSYNALVGPVPDFLADLPFLKVINLSENNFTGSVPAKLLQKSNRGSLSLSLDGNPYLCQKEPCNYPNKEGREGTKNNNVLAIIVGTATGSLLIILFVAMAIFCGLRFHRNRTLGIGTDLFRTNNRRFTYLEIVTITDNFKRIIGEGGFGKVYLGQLGDAQVAVKMLSQSSIQGYREFQAEAELLIRVHHRKLISLVGYCDEDKNLGLVYEYMALGNLKMNLSEINGNTLTWEQRLQIAIDAAQGLDYLHRGCKPPMIHRDVKSSNILINEEFNAKVADFGLSRASPLAGGHESTAVAGTPGYLDPEYFATNKLSQKSDVYSFGVVLLEIVTCRPITGSSPIDHITHYVNRMLSLGDISRIIDSRLKGKVDVNSVWRVLELAMACVAQESTGRPNMNQVATELEHCLESITKLGANIDSSMEANPTKLSIESSGVS